MNTQTPTQCAARRARSTTARRGFTARLKQLTATAALALGCLAASAQNLLVNGSFETGDLSGWTAINNIPGGPYNVYPVVAHYAEGASDGTYGIIFNYGDTQPMGVLQQTFATVPGTQYTLSFDYAVYGGGFEFGGGFAQSLIVEVSDSSLTPQVAMSAPSGNVIPPTFTTFTYTFTATAANSTLKFSDSPANFTYSEDGILDNVSIVTASPPPAPDLQVTALTTTNNKAPQGQKVTITVVVKNTGNAAAGASTTVIKDGSTVLVSVATPALGAGDSTTLRFDMRTATQNGTHVLSATADSANAVAESSETNNTKTLTVNILGNQVR